MKRTHWLLVTTGLAFSAVVLFAQKTVEPAKPETKTETAKAPEAVEYEEVWLPVGTVFNFPEGSRPAEVFPTGAKFLPSAKTPLRVRSRKKGSKISVRLEGLPLHTKYLVKPRRAGWTFEVNKGDFVERMIRRPKPVVAEPEVVEKVDVDEKKEVEAEVTTTEIETVKDTSVIATQIKETEKVSEDFSRPFHDRLFGVRASYTNNYTEHYAQYFTLPSPALLFRADIGNYRIGRFYFDYLAAMAPADLAADSTYKNPSFWKLGYHTTHLGVHFKSQATPNPAGLLFRDRLRSEVGFEGHYGFNIFDSLWLNFGTNALLMWADKPSTSGITTTTIIEMGLLVNLTADLTMTVFRQRGLFDMMAHAGTAFSLVDSTNTGYDTAGQWTSANRSGKFAGFRLGASGHFYLIDAVRLTASAFYYPLMSGGFERYTKLTRETTASMFIASFGAEFRM